MTSNFVVHVGFSKTGTTTLQKHLFVKHSQVKYLGKPFKEDVFKTLIHRLMMQESIVYDPGPLKRYVSDNRLRELDGTQRVVVLSDEMFLSYSKVRDKGIVANRIKEVFGPCKILITIRNQYELLKSAYLSRGRLMTQVPKKFEGLGVRFEEWLNLSISEKNFERGYIDHADYYKTIDYYSRLFGKENVCVLLLEEFVHNKKRYLEELSEFLGIDPVESGECVKEEHEHKDILPKELELELLRTRFFPFHKNVLIKGILKGFVSIKNRKGKYPMGGVEIPGSIVGCLEDVYKEGNRKLKEEYGLPLDKYNYPGFAT